MAQIKNENVSDDPTDPIFFLITLVQLFLFCLTFQIYILFKSTTYNFEDFARKVTLKRKMGIMTLTM